MFQARSSLQFAVDSSVPVANQVPAQSALPCLAASSSCRPLLPLSQRRSKWSLGNWFGRNRPGSKSDNKVSGGQNLDDPEVRRRAMAQQQRAAPTLSDSIFEDEVKEATKDDYQPQQSDQETLSQPPTSAEAAIYRTDPDPRSRTRWERKKVIQMIRRQTAGEEVSDYAKRTERIAMNERQLLHKSPLLETSTKKLVMLARQIQGKTLEDAMLQMTYSKKKMAKEIKVQLEEARDLAVVSRGMGLGKAGHGGDGAKTPIKIKTKDGATLKVDDPTRLYIAEAWVGRGTPRNKRIEFKGRGRTGVIVSPATSTYHSNSVHPETAPAARFLVG